MTYQNKTRELVAKRLVLSLRWGIVLASVVVLGSLMVVGKVFLEKKEFVARQMGRVEVAKGGHLQVSRYKRGSGEVIHFVLSSGEATFEPEKLPPNIYYIVETPHLYIRVIGTVFHVRVISNETFVRVDKGKVWCYPKTEDYTIDTIIAYDVPQTHTVVMKEGEKSTWKEREKTSLVHKKPTSSHRPSSPSPSLPSSQPPETPLITSSEKPLLQKSDTLFHSETKSYRVKLSSSQRLEIVSKKDGKEFIIDLSTWSKQWFKPVLLEDSVVVVSHTGIILRFRYDGKIIFKLRPVDAKLVGEPLVTTQGVILMQSQGITVCLWSGVFWTLTAEAGFLVKSLPYYNEEKDILIYANEPGSIAGYSLTKRDILWTHRLIKEFVGAPIKGKDGIAYIYGGYNHTLIAVDTTDGHFVWSVSLGMPLQKMDIIENTLAIILKSSTDSEIHLLALHNGHRIAKFSLRGKIKDSLKEEKRWYLLTDQGEIYSLALEEKSLQLLSQVIDATGLTFISNQVGVISRGGLVLLNE